MSKYSDMKIDFQQESPIVHEVPQNGSPCRTFCQFLSSLFSVLISIYLN
jgi:hypothetical protein